MIGEVGTPIETEEQGPSRPPQADEATGVASCHKINLQKNNVTYSKE